MFEQLKKKSVRKSLAGVLILLIVGSILVAVEFSNVMSLMKGHVVFEELEPDEINGSLIVDASIDMNFGCYLEEYEENTKTHARRTTDLYYVIWTGNEDSQDFRYMGIKVPASKESVMEKMAEDAYNYGYADTEEFSGAVNKMSAEEYKYFKEYFEESGFSEEEIESYTLPYYINVGALTGGAATSAYIFMLAGILMIAAAAVLLIYALCGGKLKKLKKEIDVLGVPEGQLEQEFENAQQLYEKDLLRIGNNYTFFFIGSKPHVLENRKLVWAYHVKTTHRTNGIKTGTTYQIMLITADQKRHSISVPNESKGLEVLECIGTAMPWAVIGYQDELDKMFRKDFSGFLELRYNRPLENTDENETM